MIMVFLARVYDIKINVKTLLLVTGVRRFTGVRVSVFYFVKLNLSPFFRFIVEYFVIFLQSFKFLSKN